MTTTTTTTTTPYVSHRTPVPVSIELHNVLPLFFRNDDGGDDQQQQHHEEFTKNENNLSFVPRRGGVGFGGRVGASGLGTGGLGTGGYVVARNDRHEHSIDLLCTVRLRIVICDTVVLYDCTYPRRAVCPSWQHLDERMATIPQRNNHNRPKSTTTTARSTATATPITNHLTINEYESMTARFSLVRQRGRQNGGNRNSSSINNKDSNNDNDNDDDDDDDVFLEVPIHPGKLMTISKKPDTYLPLNAVLVTYTDESIRVMPSVYKLFQDHEEIRMRMQQQQQQQQQSSSIHSAPASTAATTTAGTKITGIGSGGIGAAAAAATTATSATSARGGAGVGSSSSSPVPFSSSSKQQAAADVPVISKSFDSSTDYSTRFEDDVFDILDQVTPPTSQSRGANNDEPSYTEYVGHVNGGGGGKQTTTAATSAAVSAGGGSVANEIVRHGTTDPVPARGGSSGFDQVERYSKARSANMTTTTATVTATLDRQLFLDVNESLLPTASASSPSTTTRPRVLPVSSSSVVTSEGGRRRTATTTSRCVGGGLGDITTFGGGQVGTNSTDPSDAAVEEDEDEEDEHGVTEAELLAIQKDLKEEQIRLKWYIQEETKALEKELQQLEQTKERMKQLREQNRTLRIQTDQVVQATAQLRLEAERAAFVLSSQQILLIRDLRTVYPVTVSDGGTRYRIRGLEIPDNVLAGTVPDDELAAGVGCLCHWTVMTSKYLSVQLRYQPIYYASRSVLRDDRGVLYPLFPARNERERFHYGVSRLDCNVRCICKAINMDIPEKLHVLGKVRRVYEHIIEGK